MTPNQRCSTVDELGICANCLAYSEKAFQCPSRVCCYFCGQRHHSTLHINTPLSNNSYQNTPPFNPTPTISTNHQTYTTTSTQLPNSHNYTHFTTPITQHNPNTQSHATSVNPNAPAFNPNTDPCTSSSLQNYHTQHNTNTQVLLATALVRVLTATGNSIHLRALLDPGSEATFITGSVVQQLGLRPKRTFIEVSGLGKVSSGTCNNYVDLSFGSLHTTFQGHTRAFIFKSLTGLLPAQKIDFNKWAHIKGLNLADPSFHTPANVDLLLGNDVYADILLPDVLRGENYVAPIAQNTLLGWILMGRAPVETPQMIRSHFQFFDLDTQLRKFWEIEEEPFEKFEKDEDKQCELHFLENTKRKPNGRFEVCLPFKEKVHPALGFSHQGVLKRFYQLERRFQNNTSLYENYKKCMKEYINLGHMTEVQNLFDYTSTPYHYFIPHHAVTKESSSTTKLRVVFDASYKTSFGSSLNDQLMVGPKIQTNIIDVILRWRKYRYTFTADMEKMYRQIRVNSNDSRYQLIFWRDDPQQQIRAYRLETVTFGTASAPYLAIRVIHKLADDEATTFPLAAPILREETYVDDIISGADSIQDAIKKRNEVRNLLASAGFCLRKWTSNTEDLLADLPHADREIDFLLPFDESNHIKTLGMKWLPANDCFTFQVADLSNNEITKRSILSSIAKLFDPLGWISPCIVKAKMLMQLLWERGLEWDKPVPMEIEREWTIFRQELPSIEQVRIPRWVNTGIDCSKMEIHGFSDASEKAYAAAVYIRVLDKNNHINMHLLISKTKVAPLKSISLPRLELCGAVLMAKLVSETVRALNLISPKIVTWTDSLITLCWIKASPSRWETFVANRVAEIQKHTSSDGWMHIASELNPADIASRGVFPALLIQNELWWNGPQFLRNTWEINLPNQPTIFDTDEGKRKKKVLCGIIEDNTINTTIHKYSSLSKLTRVIAYCKRFLSYSRTPITDRQKGPLTPNELRIATLCIVRNVQGQLFPSNSKTRKSRERGLKSLNPFLDEEGILRVGGRLQNSTLNYYQQHPIILKSTHRFTEILIQDAHEKTYHGGVNKIATYLRQTYWICSLKNTAKKFVHKCNICFRYRPKPMTQLMGNLPAPRVRMSRPFSHTGVDYAGPIDIKTWRGRNAKTLKGYFSIFVCMATKAIHIEVVSDLTTQAFIAAFRRFTARRGLCVAMYSDCGTNFVGANTELQKLLNIAKFDWTSCKETLANEGTQWNFNPPASPHLGGLWEAGVKSIKFHLKRVTGNSTLTYEELSTLLTQVEACLNSRPLCPVTEDIDDLYALTPSHFLIGEQLIGPPQPYYDIEKITYLDRWKRVQGLVQSFWRRWSNEYLARLQQRPKWTRTLDNDIKIGDLVLLKDERLPPAKWSLARISKLHPGTDNLSRIVTVKSSCSSRGREFKIPIAKICSLPSNSTPDNTII